MKNKIYILLKCIISIALLICFATLWYKSDSYGSFEIVATFLSIVTGFTITGLSIIATSRFSRELYTLESSGDNSRTLLHELINRFSKGMYVFIGTILLIIIHRYLDLSNSEIDSVSIICDRILSSFICYLTVLSIYKFIQLFRIFCQFIIQESRR